jgi:hypothetical protein
MPGILRGRRNGVFYETKWSGRPLKGDDLPHQGSPNHLHFTGEYGSTGLSTKPVFPAKVLRMRDKKLFGVLRTSEMRAYLASSGSRSTG